MLTALCKITIVTAYLDSYGIPNLLHHVIKNMDFNVILELTAGVEQKNIECQFCCVVFYLNSKLCIIAAFTSGGP